MAENYYTILTNVGKAKIANAQVLGEKVVMTHLAVGDGNGMHYNPTENQTALRNEVWRGHIGSIDTDLENPNWIVLEATIPSNAGGFNVREVGIFDDEDNLIAIGKYPETYKPILTEGSAKDLYVRMIIEVTNAASVQLKIDPTIAMPSRKWVEEEIEKHAKTTASLTQRGHVQLSDDINSTSTTEAATPSVIKVVNEKIAAHLDNKGNPHSVTASQVGAIPVTDKGKANGVASLGSDGKVPSSQLSVTQPPDATTSQKGIVQLNNSTTSTSSTQAATPYAVKQVNDNITTVINNRLKDRAILLGGATKDSGTDVVALMQGAKVGGDQSIAIGYNSKAMDQDSVVIGTRNDVRGNKTLSIGYENRLDGENSVAVGNYFSSAGKNIMFIGSGRIDQYYNMKIAAEVTTVQGHFSVSGTKNFQIPHPALSKRDTHLIRHGAVESPTPGDTLYRYFVDIKEDIAQVRLCGEDKIIRSNIEKNEKGYLIRIPLPDYWVHLNKDPQVTVNGHMHFETGYGYIDIEKEQLILLLKVPESYHVILYGTRNDDNVQDWYIKGVEREVGESWNGETNLFEVEEIKNMREITQQEERDEY